VTVGNVIKLRARQGGVGRRTLRLLFDNCVSLVKSAAGISHSTGDHGNEAAFLLDCANLACTAPPRKRLTATTAFLTINSM